MSTKEEVRIPNAIKFLFGGSAGCLATMFVQPLDLIKNRMQLSGAGGAAREHANSFAAFRTIVAKEGFLALYNGISAGLLRQATYTTTRLGIYTWLFELATGDRPPNFAMKATIGLAAGAAGAFVGTPAEVALIRMTADGRLPPAERRNYANVIDAVIRIYKGEGIKGMWRGAIPTMGRAMVVNAAQLGSYSQAKEQLLATGVFQEGILLHFGSAMISGLLTTAASLPVDIAKTRIQNMKTINGKPEYSGAFDVIFSIIRKESPFALWKGFTPYYFRIGPHTVLTFIFLEQMNNFYKNYKS